MCRSFVSNFLETEDNAGPFEVVHAHDWLACSVLGLVKERRPEHRTILTMHSTEFGRCGNQLWNGSSERIRNHEHYGIVCADHVIAVSQALKRDLTWLYNVPDAKCKVIYNGVSVHKFDGFIDAGAVKRSMTLGRSINGSFQWTLVRAKAPTCCWKRCLDCSATIPGEVCFAGDGHAWQLRSAHVVWNCHATFPWLSARSS
jgi:hypothetical protein